MEERVARMLNRLRAGAGACACGAYLAGLDALHRTEILTSLAYDRLARKFGTVRELHAEAGENWNQTFYLLFFRTLGDRRNQSAYLELARRVPYATVLRERASLQHVEAMLFGASGLLDLYRHDEYTLGLRRDYEYLAAKYGIERMDAAAWNLVRLHPANHPVLRIAQAEAFFASHEFVVDRVVECRTREEVERLFGTEASAYWCTHYLPGSPSGELPKRIGAFKANILGINLVAIMQYAYGSYLDNEALRGRAIALLERLDAEDNVYMRRWRAEGVPLRNAFESQALLQLETEFCAARRCAECPVGRRRLR